MTGSRRTLRTASWREVIALFPSEADAIRNIDGWAARYGCPPPARGRFRVTLEAWSHLDIDRLMSDMSEYEPRVTVGIVGGVNNAQIPPRVDGLPIVIIQFGGRFGMIDGKHRANRWKHAPGHYAVLVIQC